jgi:hypothetical protein
VRRLQDQLSVVRASLLQHLAHKAALELKVKQQQSSNEAATIAAAAQKLKLAGVAQEGTAAADGMLQDDVPPVADGSPKRRGKQVQLDQAGRTSRPNSPGPIQLDAASDTVAAASEVVASSHSSSLKPSASAEEGAEETAATVAAASEQDAAEVCSSAQAAAVSAGSAAVLLTAAAKLQRLVEQLTQREPAVAADLSLLQWQLTTAYGSMTGAPSRSGEDMLLVDQSSNSERPVAESLAAAEQGQAAAAQPNTEDIKNSSSGAQEAAPATPAGPVKLKPADTHPLAEEAAAGQPAQHSAAEVAAAARLFSGAATTLQAPSIDWYYLEEGGSVRGAAQLVCLLAQLPVHLHALPIPVETAGVQ